MRNGVIPISKRSMRTASSSSARISPVRIPVTCIWQAAVLPLTRMPVRSKVSTKCLGVPDTFHYEWITAGDPVEMAFNTPQLDIWHADAHSAYDAGTRTINLYDTSLFRKLGTNGFYIARRYQSKLYNPHIHPDVKFIVGGKEYKSGQSVRR